MGYQIELDNLPLILAGPILRRTELDYVSVFVVLKEQKRVALRVFETTEAIKSSNRTAALTGTVNSIRLFKHVHLALVSAKVKPPQAVLSPNALYYYELFFDDVDGSNNPVSDNSTQYGFQAEKVLNTASITRDISYSSSIKLPSFLTPPDNFSELRLVHGSCRKPQNDGMDALSALDQIIKDSDKPNYPNRPHQLHLTGDQIYADDVGDPLLFMIHEAHKVLVEGDLYLGLPTDNKEVKEAFDNAIIGKRQDFVEEFCGFTSGEAKSHLFGLSEYCLYYLFSWSEVLWTNVSQLQFNDVFPGKSKTFEVTDKEGNLREYETPLYRRFNAEIKNLITFCGSLPKVSKALANCPTYMIVDDHDVTDDWFLNRAWVEKVMNKGKDDQAYAGRFVLRNAYLAFSLFQIWGNTRGDSKYSDFTQKVNDWDKSNSKINEDKDIWHQLGLPTDNEVEDFLNDLNTHHELRKSDDSHKRAWIENALRWDFRIEFKDFELIGLDTRSWRSFPKKNDGDKDGDNFCALISEQGFEKQLPDHPKSHNLICLNATPVTNFINFERAQKWTGSRIGHDLEAWGLQPIAFERLLARHAVRGSQRVLVLSGDVHYSYAARLRYWCDGTPYEENTGTHAMVCALLTSSSLDHGEGLKLPALHWWDSITLWGRSEPVERLAWNQTNENVIGKYTWGPDLIDWDVGEEKQPLVAEVNDSNSGIFKKELNDAYKTPDWRYRIDYIAGEAIPRSTSSPPSVSRTEAQANASGNCPLPAYKKTADLHKAEAKHTEGREVIGKTNLAFIELNAKPDETELIAIQHYYWYESEKFKALTKFAIPLFDKIGEYKRPTVDGDDQATGGQTIP